MPGRSGGMPEEGGPPGRAALLGVVGHEDRAFLTDAVNVRRLADHQPAVVDARLHPTDIVAHDEQDVGLGLLALLALRRLGRLPLRLRGGDEPERTGQERTGENRLAYD